MSKPTFGCGCGWVGQLQGDPYDAACPTCGATDDVALFLTDAREVVTSKSSPIRVDWLKNPRWLGLTICPGKNGLSWNRATYYARDLELDMIKLGECCDILVNLLPDEEMLELGITPSEYEYAASAQDIEVVRFPFTDNTVPPDALSLAGLLRGLRQRLAMGQRIIIHCKGGLGRSGLVAGCLMREGGDCAATVLESLTATRGPYCPTTEAQREWVVKWPRGITRCEDGLMGYAVDKVLLVRSLETGECTRVPSELILISPAGDLYLEGQPIELVPEVPLTMDMNTVGFTDVEQADVLIALAGRLNRRLMVLEPRALFNRALVGLTNQPTDQWNRQTKAWVLVYDFELAARSMSQFEVVGLEEAVDRVTAIAGDCWEGEGTPTWQTARAH